MTIATTPVTLEIKNMSKFIREYLSIIETNKIDKDLLIRVKNHANTTLSVIEKKTKVTKKIPRMHKAIFSLKVYVLIPNEILQTIPEVRRLVVEYKI
jgi:hypothetical protein